MINMQLIAAQAEKDGMDKDPEVATRIALLRTQILADAAVAKICEGATSPRMRSCMPQYDAAIHG